jgi:hypothetical protein
VQAFVELRTEDVTAASALPVARAQLAAGHALAGLRRLRLFEVTGGAGDAGELAARLHGSTQFYNPAKERCHVRTHEGEAAPVAADEVLVLVVERGGERRQAAERWWRHETGERVEVREATLWALRFEPGTDGLEAAEALAVARDRGHGLFANPHAQDHRVSRGGLPLDWITQRPASAARRRKAPA